MELPEGFVMAWWRLRYIAFRVGTEAAGLIVRPLPIPFERPNTLYYNLMAWLWGRALAGDAVTSFADYCPMVLGAAYRPTEGQQP